MEPTSRLAELRTTGVPTPFVLEACFHVRDVVGAEAALHKMLASFRAENDREFFQVAITKVMDVCLRLLPERMLTGNVPENASNKAPSRIDQTAELILQFVAYHSRNNHETACEYSIGRELDLEKLDAIYHLGTLVKLKYIRADRRERYSVKYNIEHAGIEYLREHQIMPQYPPSWVRPPQPNVDLEKLAVLEKLAADSLQ